MPNKSKIAYKIKKLRQILLGTRYVHIGKNTENLNNDMVMRHTKVENPEFTKIMPNCNLNK